MKNVLLLALAVFFFNANLTEAQTKIIAYKSHSGSAEHFFDALEMDLFSAPNSNLGAAPERYITNAQLDSLIFLSDTSTIMVTSDRCYNLDSNNSWGRNPKEIWRAGRDTVINHKSFNRQIPEQTIRKIIKTEYHFANNADDISFVNHQPEKGESSQKPEKTKKKKKKKVKKNKSSKSPKKGIRSLFKKPGCTSFITLCFVTLGFSYRFRKKNKRIQKS